MSQFMVISRNPKGQRVTSVAEAQTRQALLGQLKGSGLMVVEVREVAAQAQAAADKQRGKGLSWSWNLFGTVQLGEMAVFWREFSTMVGAGLPVVEALDSIAQELEHVKLKETLTQVITNMWEGLSLAQSIRKHPRVFSPMVVSLIGAAEESGSLVEVTEQLATYLETYDRVIRKFKAALSYPIFLCGFFLVVLGVATFWLIPKFRSIYAGFRAKLPPLTEAVFAVNQVILTHLPWIVGGCLAASVMLVLWSRRPSGRAVLDRAMLKLPVLGELALRVAVARLCRSLAILLSSGVPINQALEMVEETTGNKVVAKAIWNSREEILKGGKIAASMKRQSVFPPMLIRMVSAGEETGDLSGLLEKVANFYEMRVDAALTTINALVEPILIVVIGGFVLIFVVAMYMPIFMLGMAVHG